MGKITQKGKSASEASYGRLRKRTAFVFFARRFCSRIISPVSLRSKRFRRVFGRPFEAFFAFLVGQKLGRYRRAFRRFEAFFASVLRSPQFLRRQKAKNASNGWPKTLRKRLLRRLFPSAKPVYRLSIHNKTMLMTGIQLHVM